MNSISGESSLNEYDNEKFWDKSEEEAKEVELEQQQKRKRPRHRSTTSSNNFQH